LSSRRLKSLESEKQIFHFSFDSSHFPFLISHFPFSVSISILGTDGSLSGQRKFPNGPTEVPMVSEMKNENCQMRNGKFSFRFQPSLKNPATHPLPRGGTDIIDTAKLSMKPVKW